MTLSGDCLECGLYQHARTWRVPPEYDSRPGLEGRPWVLVLGQAPGVHEDQHGRPFVALEGVRNAGSFLRLWLNRLEVRWVLDNVVRCFPGRAADGRDNAPSSLQVHLCMGQFFSLQAPDGSLFRVIACLGAVAVEALLGSNVSLSQARSPVRLDGYLDVWVVGTYHPVNHIVGRRDLSEEYYRFWRLVEDLAMGRYQDPAFRYEVLRHPERARQCLESVPLRQVVLDVETAECRAAADKKTLWHPRSQLLCCSCTFVSEDYPTWVVASTALTADVVRAICRGREVWAHNLKFDANAIWRFLGVDILEEAESWGDTLLEFYLPNQSARELGLKSLASRYLAAPPWHEQIQEALRQSGSTMADLPEETVLQYCAQDTFWCARLLREVIPSLSSQGSPLVKQLYQRLLPVLCVIERGGLPISAAWLSALERAHRRLQAELEALLSSQPEVQEAVRQSGFPVSAHGRRFYDALVEALGAQVPRNQVGYASRKEDLHRLARIVSPDPLKDQQVSRSRQEWIWWYYYRLRQSVDLVSKFVRVFSAYIVDDVVHPSFRIAAVSESQVLWGADDIGGGAQTGRLAASDPPVHQIKHDPTLRAAIRAPQGWVLGELDYDRIEPVCLAVESGCANWIRVFQRGQDLYRVEACQMLEQPIPWELSDDALREWLQSAVPSDVRTKAKVQVLARMYGETVDAVAQRMGIPYQQAHHWWTLFDRANPEISAWQARQLALVQSGQPVVTRFGRRRFFSPEEQNKIINFPIQSLASDLTCWKLCDLYAAAQRESWPLRIINVVHDAVWVLVREDVALDVLRCCARILEDTSTLPFEWSIPLSVTLKMGHHLGSMEEVR